MSSYLAKPLGPPTVCAALQNWASSVLHHLVSCFCRLSPMMPFLMVSLSCMGPGAGAGAGEWGVWPFCHMFTNQNVLNQ